MFMLLLLMLLVQSEGRDLRGHYHRRHPKRGGGDVNATVEKSPYSFERITEETAKVLAECPRAKPCFRYPGLYGHALDYYVMVDPQRQILMEFSPKAGCTAAVVTFLEAMGFKQGEQYFGWPHTFRDTYYTPHCGVYTPCHYYDENWFRFKVVRNPFDRAVSGYLESLGYPMVSKLLPDEVKNMSFERFIDYQLSLPADKWQFIANRHAGPQSQYYERFVYSENLKMPGSSPKYPPIFHEIVKTEESEKGFNRIFEKTGVRYQLRYTSKHFSKKNSEINYYVGKMSFEKLYALGAVPQNYGYFYNEELKKKAEKLFEWDMLLYNYSFPYKIIG